MGFEFRISNFVCSAMSSERIDMLVGLDVGNAVMKRLSDPRRMIYAAIAFAILLEWEQSGRPSPISKIRIYQRP